MRILYNQLLALQLDYLNDNYGRDLINSLSLDTWRLQIYSGLCLEFRLALILFSLILPHLIISERLEFRADGEGGDMFPQLSVLESVVIVNNEKNEKRGAPSDSDTSDGVVEVGKLFEDQSASSVEVVSGGLTTSKLEGNHFAERYGSGT